MAGGAACGGRGAPGGGGGGRMSLARLEEDDSERDKGGRAKRGGGGLCGAVPCVIGCMLGARRCWRARPRARRLGVVIAAAALALLGCFGVTFVLGSQRAYCRGIGSVAGIRLGYTDALAWRDASRSRPDTGLAALVSRVQVPVPLRVCVCVCFGVCVCVGGGGRSPAGGRACAASGP